jgi:hypothetical protein
LYHWQANGEAEFDMAPLRLRVKNHVDALKIFSLFTEMLGKIEQQIVSIMILSTVDHTIFLQ